jgi:predicted dithiol-disulfide oxidoreductase (DUF899 family)
MKTIEPTIEGHKVVSRDEWIAARKELLIKEKEQTRLRDQLSAERRALPWVKVEKEYVFDAPEGKVTLADLFDGRSQLVVKHFMLGPEWKEGCVGCSFEVDHIEGALVHLEHHDVTYVVISRAPLADIEAFKKRMGWRFKWVSSAGNDFNYDYQVSFTKEQLATGKYITTTGWRSPRSMNSRASAFSTRMNQATSFTLIPPTDAGLRS